ncbi:uncharacterized protein LOC133914753 [Phragmites australis]|uniref:uncharacterized protein LOC133914753 n=1 Tax=Phragmites australis TaxID=29695 RepID=UPI002D78F51A|nr:uncharacterized protein LOC133914753 [Phragmites australis]
MVVTNYLRRRLAPLREHARAAWMYTGSGDLTRTHIGPDGDLDEGALATLLKVVIGVDDLAQAVMPREELALCVDLGQAALQASMSEFDAQGMVDRPGCQNPGTIQIPGVDDNGGRGAAAEGSRPAARGDKGKHPWAYVRQLSSSSSPSPPRQRPAVGGATEGDRGGQSSGAESGTEARSRAWEPEGQGPAGGATAGSCTDQPSEKNSGATAGASPQRPEGQSPPPKRRKAEPGPKPQIPDFRIPKSRWRYRGPKTTPPKDPAGGQRQPEEPRPVPVPGPSAPVPRAPASPELRAPAGLEQQTPTEPAPSPPRKEGSSPQPSSGQAPEPLPEVLGSAWVVIGWLELAVAVEKAEHVALVDERGRLEEARKLLETRVASAHASYEKSMREVVEERETLEETCDEAVAA